MSHDRGCPCGRERGEYDECTKPDCYKGTQAMTTKTKKQYLWVRKDWTMSIIEDPVALLNPTQYSNFDAENDTIYEIGPEVEIKVTVEVKNKNPVYRERGYVEGTR